MPPMGWGAPWPCGGGGAAIVATLVRDMREVRTNAGMETWAQGGCGCNEIFKIGRPVHRKLSKVKRVGSASTRISGRLALFLKYPRLCPRLCGIFIIRNIQCRFLRGALAYLGTRYSVSVMVLSLN